jgi:hypothetical protein
MHIENVIFIENLLTKKIGCYILQAIFDLNKKIFAEGIPDLFSFKIKWILKSISSVD